MADPKTKDEILRTTDIAKRITRFHEIVERAAKTAPFMNKQIGSHRITVSVTGVARASLPQSSDAQRRRDINEVKTSEERIKKNIIILKKLLVSYSNDFLKEVEKITKENSSALIHGGAINEARLKSLTNKFEKNAKLLDFPDAFSAFPSVIGAEYDLIISKLIPLTVKYPQIAYDVSEAKRINEQLKAHKTEIKKTASGTDRDVVVNYIKNYLAEVGRSVEGKNAGAFSTAWDINLVPQLKIFYKHAQEEIVLINFAFTEYCDMIDSHLKKPIKRL